MEQKNDVYIGSVGRTLAIQFVGSLALAIAYIAWVAPQQQSAAEDKRIADGLSRNSAEIERLRGQNSDLTTRVKELEILVKRGTEDRYTAKDAAKDRQLYDERQEATERSISRLDSQAGAIVRYLTEERRYRESNGK